MRDGRLQGKRERGGGGGETERERERDGVDQLDDYGWCGVADSIPYT